ncbi:MAG TPA: SDR family NAD(P)-dependent oxidoreductase [Dehalococcoidia bacterium]|nr:SDR family NAD(P)-dependent oxidoreductase [Dehalococcoidia bacterium]
MSLEAKKVLVTGAGGFIGSHLTERLIDLGTHVRAFVRYNSRNDWGLLESLTKDKLSEVEIVLGDLRDGEAVRQAADTVDIIFHLGSLIAIPYSYVHPRETIETNVMGTLNVMAAANKAGVERVVHTSTSEVYGTAQYVPIDERHPLQGQSPYSASKIAADKIAESFHRSFGLPVSTIRPFNTFGPRQSARAVIPTIITQALAPGTTMVLGSLRPTRDYTYVDDTVQGFIKVAESDHSVGETINIGSNFEISIGDIAKKVIATIGVSKQISLDVNRVRPENSEVERLWCDNTKAKRLLEWEPRVSFEEGLSRTIQWISAHRHSYKTDLYNV